MKHLIWAGALAMAAVMFGGSVGAVRDAAAAPGTGTICNDKQCNTATKACEPFVNTPRSRCTGTVSYKRQLINGVWTWVRVNTGCTTYLCN